MLDDFPIAIPEIPVADIERSAEYYVRTLGFHLDWHSAGDGLAGISQGQSLMFLADTSFRQPHGNAAPIVIWLNQNSKSGVDDLHTRWREAGAKILEAPEDKPW